MTRDEYDALRADVAERGICTPLDITPQGVVLDGRQRLRVAHALKLPSVPVRLVTPDDELVHMMSAALTRRHLTQSQKAVLAVELAASRQAHAPAVERHDVHGRQAEPTGVATLPPPGEKRRASTARIVGVSERTVQDVVTVRQANPDLYQAIKDGRIPAHKAARQVRRTARDAALPAAPPLPTDPFDLIYADPPWQLGNPDSAYAPENHYPTLPLDQIKALQPPAADNAILYLWAVAGKLPEALEVMSDWGFTYRGEMVWVKPSVGLGTWLRYSHEPLLVGSRGSFHPPEPEDRFSSVIEADRRRHSEKPTAVYERLERAHPFAAKLELFARNPRPGWACWGNEVEAA